MTWAAAAALILIGGRWLVEFWLGRLNRQHVLAHAERIPEALENVIDANTYAKSMQYTLAKSRLAQVERTYDAVVLLAVLFSGVLPWVFAQFVGRFGTSVWVMAAFLFIVGLALSLTSLPVDWYEQFRLEERFHFNTTTQLLWWTDRMKGVALGILLGYPLLVLVLALADWTGGSWWLWAWACLMGVQLIMLVLAPVVILPLFNKLTPLASGTLRDRLLALAQRTGFSVQSIQLMDGSRRSRHANAFFTGLGRFRKVVLFDTLVQQLADDELEAVLAHEIGHFKLKHIPRMLCWSAAGSLVAFFVLGVLASQEWFYRSFGFAPDHIAPALLLFGLLSGVLTFWLQPIGHWWSRRHEYQADAFASAATGGPLPLIGALRKLTEKNLANLTPHPYYSSFYYSHPTLLEREAALNIGRAAKVDAS